MPHKPIRSAQATRFFGAICLMMAAVGLTAASAKDGPPPYDWYACEDEARRLELQEQIPKLLLTAVTYTETGRRGPQGQRIMSWPWTLHAEGKSLHFRTKEDAVKAVRALMDRGVRNIDVGCMQINLRYHPQAFTSVEEALDPLANLSYGVAFLKRLQARHKGWPAAIQHYHSANRSVNEVYRKKVFSIWDQLRRRSERDRARNDVSALPPPTHQNEMAFSDRARSVRGETLLGRRENRKAWTVQTPGSHNRPPIRESMRRRPLEPLPFHAQLPHAQFVVALTPPHSGTKTEMSIAWADNPLHPATNQDDGLKLLQLVRITKKGKPNAETAAATPLEALTPGAGVRMQDNGSF